MKLENRVTTYYPFLDGMRALAVLWVLFHHLRLGFDLKALFPNEFFHAILNKVSLLGFLGVDVFFVISGFLIMGLLLPDLDGRIRIQRFYLRRFLKIYPHYLFIVLTGLLIAFALSMVEKKSPVSYASYFVFLQNYVPPVRILGHLWSLAIEEHFYLVLPLILQSLCRLEKDVVKRRSWALVVLVGLIFLGNGIRFWGFRGLHSFDDPTVWQFTHVRFDALLFGCVLRLIEPGLLKITSPWKEFLRAMFLILGGTIFITFFFRYNPIDWAYYSFACLATGCVLMAALLGFTPLNRILTNRVFVWTGKSSYGIYLWHYIILFPFVKLIPYGGVILTAGLWIASSIALGALTTATLERYFLNRRKQWAP